MGSVDAKASNIRDGNPAHCVQIRVELPFEGGQRQLERCWRFKLPDESADTSDANHQPRIPGLTGDELEVAQVHSCSRGQSSGQTLNIRIPGQQDTLLVRCSGQYNQPEGANEKMASVPITGTSKESGLETAWHSAALVIRSTLRCANRRNRLLAEIWHARAYRLRSPRWMSIFGPISQRRHRGNPQK